MQPQSPVVRKIFIHYNKYKILHLIKKKVCTTHKVVNLDFSAMCNMKLSNNFPLKNPPKNFLGVTHS